MKEMETVARCGSFPLCACLEKHTDEGCTCALAAGGRMQPPCVRAPSEAPAEAGIGAGRPRSIGVERPGTSPQPPSSPAM